MKTIFLSSNYNDFPRMQRVRDLYLIPEGYKVTSRWINGEHKMYEGTSDLEMNNKFASEDLEDLDAADILIAFTDSKTKTRGRGGRHVEFGYALAMDMPIILVGPKEHVFHFYSVANIQNVGTLEDILVILRRYKNSTW